jgi:hypothetical protein
LAVGQYEERTLPGRRETVSSTAVGGSLSPARLIVTRAGAELKVPSFTLKEKLA